MKTEFFPQVHSRGSISCAGLKVRTNLAKAEDDCSNIWKNQFLPRMEEFPPDPHHPDEWYGVFFWVANDTFDYWAVDSLADGAQPPQGMDSLVIPGGQYIKVEIPSLAIAPECRRFIYSQWLPNNKDIAVTADRPSLELYTRDFYQSGKLAILFPIIQR